MSSSLARGLGRMPAHAPLVTARLSSQGRGDKVPSVPAHGPSDLTPLAMAARRAVQLLPNAVNGFVPASIRPQPALSARISSRSLAVQAVRPRGLARARQCSVRYASSDSSAEKLGKTGLYELHGKYGAKFVPFGGYSMPVQYSDLSIIDSHNWTREKASLFDVGHMSVFFSNALLHTSSIDTPSGSSMSSRVLAPKLSCRPSPLPPCRRSPNSTLACLHCCTVRRAASWMTPS